MAALLALLAGLLVWQRRSGAAGEASPEPIAFAPAAQETAAPGSPAMASLQEPTLVLGQPPEKRPRIELELHPRRGGLNLLSITIESEVLVRNAGDAPARDVLVEATLLSARSDQEEEPGAVLARAISRPAVPGFILAPGEERRVRLISALPLAAVEPMVAGGRAMVVPVVAVNASYGWDDGAGQTAASYMVGVERPRQAKLAPFWLDAPRVYDTLAARPHSLGIRR